MDAPTDRTGTTASPRPRRRRWLRRLLVAGGVLVLLLLVLVALAPMIAGWIAPGIASDAITKSINGSATVERVSLSWFGGQRIGPILIRDDKGTEVARASVKVSRGLSGLARGALGLGGMDAGEIRIDGRADVVREADGRLNIQRVLTPKASAPRPPAPSEPARVPPSLAAKLVIDSLQLTFRDDSPGADPAARVVLLKDVKGEGVFAAGKPATLVLTGSAAYGRDAQSAAAPAGTVKINATADNLADATGLVTPDQATFDATVEATDMAVAPADALTRMNGALVQGLGDRLTVTLKASGTVKDATAEVKAAATGLDADVTLRYADGGSGAILSAPRPGSVRIQTGALRALVPGFKESLDQQQLATISSWPDLTVALERLSVRVPTGGSSGPDLRGSSVSLSATTGPMSGEVVTPGPDGAAGPRRPFTLTPMTFTVESEDLAGAVRLKGDGAATIDGQPAGSLAIDVVAGGLLDDAGRPAAGPPRNLRGSVLLKETSTALAQPLVEAAGIDLPGDVGPTLDLDLRATARSTEAASGIPTTDLDLVVRSAKVFSRAALTLDQSGLRGRDSQERSAVELTMASAASIAGRLAEQAGSARIAGAGPLRLAVTRLDVPFAPGGTTPALDRAAGQVQLSLSNLTVQPLYPGPDPKAPPAPPPGPPLMVRTLEFAGTLTPGAAPRVGLDAQFAHAGSPFTVKGDFALEQLLQPGAPGSAPKVTPDRARPVGTLAITSAPTSLARLMPPQTPAAPGAPVLDIPGLLRDAVGPSLTVVTETSVAKARADRLNIVTKIESEGIKGVVHGGVVPNAMAMDKADLRASVTPALLSTLLASFAPTLEQRPTLAAPAVITIGFDPLRIPLAPGGGFKPDFTGAGDVSGRIGLDGRLLVQSLQLKNADGSVRDLGAVGLEDLQIIAGAPVKALMADAGGTGIGTAGLKAKVLAGPQGERLADLDATAKVELTGGKPAGPLAATVKVTDANTSGLDRLLQQSGRLAGALGPTLSLDAEADVQLPSAAAEPGAAPFEKISLSASASSANLKMDKPIKATVAPERMGLDAPLVLTWTMDPAFANAFLAPPPPAPGQPARPPSAAFTAPTVFTVSVQRLAMGPAATPLKPGVFELQANVDAPSMAMTLGDAPAKFGALKMKAGSLKQAGSIGFSLAVNAADAASTGSPVDVSGGVLGLCDEQGRLTMDKAVINAKADANGFPTALVDALVHHDGLLVEVLGPTVTLDAQAAGLPLSAAGDGGGALSAKLSSERAAANLKGVIRDGAFVAQGPVNTQLSVITPQLGERLVKGLPMVGVVAKQPEDGPAALVARGLTVPIDGDMRKLNGDLTFNLGLVRFETSEKFASILKVLDQRQSGQLGRKVAPFTASIKEGVMTYDRYTLPLGEFSVETQGVVDLVNRQVDVVTFIPLGALTDEAAGAFNTDLGKLMGKLPIIEQTSMLPFRTTGSFDDPKTKPDLEAYAKNLGQELNPIKRIKELGEKIGGGGK